jgi:hypothetical protein
MGTTDVRDRREVLARRGTLWESRGREPLGMAAEGVDVILTAFGQRDQTEEAVERIRTKLSS